MGASPYDDLDLTALAQRALRPARPGLAAARAALDGASVGDAWERLASRGCVPLAWADGSVTREFVLACGVCRRDGWLYGWSHEGTEIDPCPACGGYGWRVVAGAPNLDACLALASDPVGVATAEAIAFEAVARVGAWGPPQGPLRVDSWRPPPPPALPTRVAWWIQAPHEVVQVGPMSPRWGFMESDTKTSRDYFYDGEDDFYQPLPPALVAALEARDDLRVVDDALWDHPLAVNLRRAPGLLTALRQRARWQAGLARGVAGLDRGPDPFAPLLALAEAGYWITAITERAVVLVASCVDGPEAFIEAPDAPQTR